MAIKTDGYAEGRSRQDSPSTQRTDFDLMVVKTDGYVEGRARPNEVLAHSEQTSV